MRRRQIVDRLEIYRLFASVCHRGRRCWNEPRRTNRRKPDTAGQDLLGAPDSEQKRLCTWDSSGRTQRACRLREGEGRRLKEEGYCCCCCCCYTDALSHVQSPAAAERSRWPPVSQPTRQFLSDCEPCEVIILLSVYRQVIPLSPTIIRRCQQQITSDLYRASACIACTARYYFTDSVCPSVCMSVRRTLIFVYMNENVVNFFDHLLEPSLQFLSPAPLKIPRPLQPGN